MLYSLASRSLNRWGYNTLKLMVKGEYEVHHEDLIPYHHAVIQLVNTFESFYIIHVSHLQNTKADALADTLAFPADTSYHLTVATVISYV